MSNVSVELLYPIDSEWNVRPREVGSVLICGSLQGRTEEDILEGIRVCRETAVRYNDGTVEYNPEGLAEDVIANITRQYGDAVVARGRCRIHGPYAAHNAIPPHVGYEL